MLTFDDIKAMQRGREAEIKEKATQEVDRLIGGMENEAQAQNQKAQAQAKASSQAQNPEEAQAHAQEIAGQLADMEDAQAEEAFNTLPPEMQQMVMEVMQGGGGQEESTETHEQEMQEPRQETLQR